MTLTTELPPWCRRRPLPQGKLPACRTTVFREWPYLYDGDVAYETQYLQRYTTCPDFLLNPCAGGRRSSRGSLHGPTPGADLSAEFKTPFEAAGEPVSAYFYCGESVVSPAFRGHGLGKNLLRRARSPCPHPPPAIRHHTCFCAIERPLPDTRRPPAHRELHGFWKRLAYKRHPTLAASLAWKEIGSPTENPPHPPLWIKENTSTPQVNP